MCASIPCRISKQIYRAGEYVFCSNLALYFYKLMFEAKSSIGILPLLIANTDSVTHL